MFGAPHAPCTTSGVDLVGRADTCMRMYVCVYIYMDILLCLFICLSMYVQKTHVHLCLSAFIYFCLLLIITSFYFGIRSSGESVRAEGGK